MNKILSISYFIDNLIKVISILARWSVLIMLGLGFWNVVGRYLGVIIGYNLSSNKLIEGQWYLFDVIFLLGLGWTLQTDTHVRVDIFQSQWTRKRKAIYELLGTLILLLPFSIGVMIVSISPTIQSWSIAEASPDPNGLARFWIKTLIPLSFLLLSLQGISQAIKNWAYIRQSSNNKHTFLDKEKGIDRN